MHRYIRISKNVITPYVINLPVCNIKLDKVINSVCLHIACQQVQLPSLMLTLVLVLVQSILMMWSAVAVRIASLNVHEAPLSAAQEATGRMLE